VVHSFLARSQATVAEAINPYLAFETLYSR